MSRLIYADFLIDCFQMLGDYDFGWHLDEVIEEIEDAPTAYDVDKVVEEINMAFDEVDWTGFISREEIINIVKRGGVE